MTKLRLLLLDTVIVIHLHELGLWKEIISRCDVHLSRGIVSESQYYPDENRELHPIDMSHYESSRQITVHDVSLSDIKHLKAQFGPVFLEKIDAGEAELLSVLYNSFEEYRICSADAIIYRVLGALKQSGKGISLEELLKDAGITRSLNHPYTKSFREQYSQQGFQEGITGLASKS